MMGQARQFSHMNVPSPLVASRTKPIRVETNKKTWLIPKKQENGLVVWYFKWTEQNSGQIKEMVYVCSMNPWVVETVWKRAREPSGCLWLNGKWDCAVPLWISFSTQEPQNNYVRTTNITLGFQLFSCIGCFSVRYMILNDEKKNVSAGIMSVNNKHWASD